MENIRVANMGDRDTFRELWDICFGDSKRFTDWFFTERYVPEYSVCLVEGGRICSAMQSYPIHLNVRGRLFPAVVLAGVSTRPECEGRGFMSRGLKFFMQHIRALQIPFVAHTPARLTTFFSRGHYPVSETAHIELKEDRCPDLPGVLCAHGMYEDLAALQICYQDVMRRYSGGVSRALADFAYKCRDYAADGAQCLAWIQDGAARGYAIYYAGQTHVHAEEVIARDEEALRILIDGLRNQAAGRELHIKLPPDAQTDFPVQVRPQGVMGAADIGSLLKQILNDPAFVFEIVDRTVPQNEGVFDGCGRTTDRKPMFTLEAGRLTQQLIGYRSMREMIDAGDAKADDEQAVAALDAALPKQKCFIVDEY
jgi:predicted acetyltransferase